MPVTVTEPLDPIQWTREEQESMYARLAEILEVPDGCDYASQTDQELSDSLNACSQEISTRPAATTQAQNAIAFMGDTVVIPIGS